MALPRNTCRTLVVDVAHHAVIHDVLVALAVVVICVIVHLGEDMLAVKVSAGLAVELDAVVTVVGQIDGLLDTATFPGAAVDAVGNVLRPGVITGGRVGNQIIVVCGVAPEIELEPLLLIYLVGIGHGLYGVERAIDVKRGFGHAALGHAGEDGIGADIVDADLIEGDFAGVFIPFAEFMILACDAIVDERVGVIVINRNENGALAVVHDVDVGLRGLLDNLEGGNEDFHRGNFTLLHAFNLCIGHGNDILVVISAWIHIGIPHLHVVNKQVHFPLTVGIDGDNVLGDLKFNRGHWGNGHLHGRNVNIYHINFALLHAFSLCIGHGNDKHVVIRAWIHIGILHLHVVDKQVHFPLSVGIDGDIALVDFILNSGHRGDW